MATQHTLTNRDDENLIADCEVCGKRVKTERRGKHQPRCKNAGREQRRRYKQRNVESKGGPSKHALEGGTTCPICGPVTPVPWGRGFMCPNRAKELGWKPPEEMEPRCHRCESFLIAGVCPFCTPVRAPIPDGMHVGELPLTGRNESAVPGWKVIGPPLPPDSPWAKYLEDLDSAI
jgi:hypothetical protein